MSETRCPECGATLGHFPQCPTRKPATPQIVTWHAWRGSVRVASAEFPATMSGREVRDHFCDKGLNTGFSLRVTIARPLVGMLATLQVGSDFYPYDVLRVSASGSKLELRARQARGPMTAEDPKGQIRIAWRDGNGDYRSGPARCLVSFGEAELSLDPSF